MGTRQEYNYHFTHYVTDQVYWTCTLQYTRIRYSVETLHPGTAPCCVQIQVSELGKTVACEQALDENGKNSARAK